MDLKEALLGREVDSLEMPVEKQAPVEEALVDKLVKALDKYFSGSKQEKVEVVKAVEEEKRMAMFVVLQPEVADAHGDIYSEEEIEKACINFNTLCNRANLLHKAHTEEARIVQSYTIPVDMQLEDGRTILKGSWVQWWHCAESEGGEAIWKAIKAGEINGVSIGCVAQFEEVEDAE